LNDETIEFDNEPGDGAAPARSALVQQVIPVAFAVISTFFFQVIVANFTDEDGFARALFLPGDSFFEQAVPLSIMFLFFWAMCDLVLKIRTINGQLRSLAQEALNKCVDLVSHDNLDEAIRGVNRAQGNDRGGQVFQTVGTLLEHLRYAGDPQRSHEFFRHKFDLDAEKTASSYTVVRIFIWAMPILGFIGTVLGISMAVGDFAGFLSGDIDDIELVKRELANVSSGLSFAFNTTLLGLLTSLAAMMLTTYVQGKNEGLARGVEELCLRIIAVAGRDASKAFTGVGEIDNGLLLQSMQAFTAMMGKESERLRSGFDAFNARFLEVGNQIAEAYSGLGASLQEQASVSASRMQESVSQMTNALADASGAFSETTTALSRDLESFAPDLGGMRSAIVEGLDRMDRYHNHFEEVLRANTEEVVAAQEKLGTRITEGLERMDLSNTQFEEALRANAEQVFASHEKLGATLAQGIGQVDLSNKAFGEALSANTRQVVEAQEKMGERVDEVIRTNAQQVLGSQEKMTEQVEAVLRASAQQVAASQESMAEKVEQVLSASAQQVAGSQESMAGKVDEVLRFSTQQVVGSQESVAGKVEEALRASAQQVVGAQESVAGKVEEALRASAQQLMGSQQSMSGKVDEALRANAQQVVGSQDKMAERVEEVLRANAEQVVGSQESMAGKVDEVLRASAQQVVGSQEKIAEKVEQVLRSNAQQVVASQEKLGEKVEAIRPTQDLMARVSQSVEDTSAALRQVRELHEALLPVLETLSQPMELKMVPAPRRPAEDAE